MLRLRYALAVAIQVSLGCSHVGVPAFRSMRIEVNNKDELQLTFWLSISTIKHRRFLQRHQSSIILMFPKDAQRNGATYGIKRWRQPCITPDEIQENPMNCIFPVIRPLLGPELRTKRLAEQIHSPLLPLELERNHGDHEQYPHQQFHLLHPVPWYLLLL